MARNSAKSKPRVARSRTNPAPDVRGSTRRSATVGGRADSGVPPADSKAGVSPQIQIRKIETLIPYKRNARTHSEEQIAQVAASIREFGWTNPILLDGVGGVIAGHARLAAARLLDLKQVPCIELSHLTEAQKRAYILADNRLALNADWDISLLAGELQDLKGLDFDLSLLGFGEQNLTELLAYSPGTEGLTDPDECPEVPENPVTKLGDLWILGKHRLLCGDATKAPDVERLMASTKADMVFTDPPYGVNYEGGHFHGRGIVRKREVLAGDKNAGIYEKALPILLPFVDGPCYVWFAHSRGYEVFKTLHENRCQISAVLVWHKTNATYAALNSQYKQRHEPCVYFKPSGSMLRWTGAATESTLWEEKRDAQNTLHPTQKPVCLAERAIRNHRANTILDVFGGSGSTLIACETTSRRCRMLEIAPAYCDVIIQRWQNFTGQEATLDGTKKTFAQISKKQAA